MTGISEQHEVIEYLWEHRMIDDGEEHYKQTIKNKCLNETKLGEKLLNDIASTVVETLEQRIRSAKKALFKSNGRQQHWSYLLPLVKAESGAWAITECLMFELSRPQNPTYHHICLALADIYIRQILFDKWLTKEKGYATAFLRKNSSALATKAQHLRFSRRLEKKIASVIDGDDYELNRRAKISLGALLFNCIETAQPDLLTQRASNKGKIKKKFGATKIYFSDDFLDDVNRLHGVASLTQPDRKPMLIPPQPYKRKENGQVTGGYYLLENKVYRTDWQPHKFNPSDEAIESLNLIQATPWRVNKNVLHFLLRNPVIAPQYPHRKPVKLANALWEKLDDQTKLKVQQQYSDEMAEFVSTTSKAMTYERQINQAMELEDKTAFWQPHVCDFRGRLYPANQMLTSQGDHVAKALIEFANGKRLGKQGLNALKLQVANTYKWDKATINERYQNVNLMADEIIKMVDSDQLAMKYINQADEPMMFYAAAMELGKALRCKNPERFVSHVPCHVDGVTNGLQILSLLGKDLVGAEKTNCTATLTRNDLYIEVAKRIRLIIGELKNSTEDPITLSVCEVWSKQISDDKVARMITKRPLMTTSYGVTREGIREQLVNDRLVDNVEIPECFSHLPIKQARHKLAGYMRDWICQARTEAVEQSVKIMDYLKETAKVLAENGYPLSWVTPDGCLVSQQYVVLKSKNVRTFDNFMRRLVCRTDKLSPSKNAGAAAPNVVHSLDATMLRKTALRLSHCEPAIKDMAFVHDSYAVHACNLQVLNYELRKVAVEMFSGNWLTDDFHKAIVKLVGDEVSLPTPPTQGDLEVSKEIPNAVYFFS